MREEYDFEKYCGDHFPDAGTIRIGEQIVFDSGKKINVKPQNRRAGYLFQNYALFPNMTVEQNIGQDFREAGRKSGNGCGRWSGNFSWTVWNDGFRENFPAGSKQRTALARIMAYKPEIILLDEPFSALDIYLKDNLQREMENMLKDYEGTVILVSHDRDEVYRFCEETVILDHGNVLVSDKTKELFQNPRLKEAAKLTGCKNFFKAKRVDAHTVELTEWGLFLHVRKDVPENCEWIGYRAHDFIPVWGERKKNSIPVCVENTAQLPFEVQYYLTVSGEKKTNDPETVRWFVQREKIAQLKEKGMPDHLQLSEECMMFLA